MSNEAVPVPPPVTWAQRDDQIYLSIAKEFESSDYSFTEDSFSFKGTGKADKKKYEVTLNFLHKIDQKSVVYKNSVRILEFEVKKAEEGIWNSLTNDKKKPHFLKVDFNKWADDDSDDGGKKAFDSKWPEYLQAREKPAFDLDEEAEEEDSDDENMPGLY